MAECLSYTCARWWLSRMLVSVVGVLVLVPLAIACEPREVVELVHQRLVLMPAVARYKREYGLAVEDSERELLVLAQAQRDATRHGLSGEGVIALMRAQIEAAKGVQNAVMRKGQPLPAQKLPVEYLRTEIRPQLIRLGERQLATLRCVLQAGGGFSEAEADYLQLLLSQLPVSPDGQAALMEGLAGVSLVAPGEPSDLR